MRKWHDKEANNDNSNTAENSTEKKKKNPQPNKTYTYVCMHDVYIRFVYGEAQQTF